VAITQFILGIRPTFDGLQIAPVIPQNWKGFKVQREFRGCLYDVSVDRIGTGNHVSLKVDGNSIPGNTVPLPSDDVKSVQVKVDIG
jgi:cellobiose phosphorylase